MEINEKNVRKAVEDWYEGTSDAAQEALLCHYFAQTPPSEIPDDLASTAAIFRGNAILSQKQMSEKTAVPHRKPAAWIWIAVSAAAVLLLLVFLPFAMRQTDLNPENHVAVTTEKSEQIIENQPTVKKSDSPMQSECVSEEFTAAVSQSKATQRQTAHTEQTYGYDFDGSVITDENVALQSVEYLSFLELLDENISTISDF